MWLVEVPPDFDVSSLDGVKFPLPSQSDAPADGEGSLLGTVGGTHTLRASEPAFADEFVCVLPSKRKRRLVPSRRFERVFRLVANEPAALVGTAVQRCSKPERRQPEGLARYGEAPAPTSAERKRRRGAATATQQEEAAAAAAASESESPKKKRQKSAKKEKKKKKKPS